MSALGFSWVRWFALVPGLFLLLGCQNQVRETAQGPWVDVPPGSTLTFNRAVSIPQDRARVFFRGGRQMSTGASIGPSCGLEVRTIPRDGPRAVEPAIFTITRVENVWAQVARLEQPGQVRFQLANATDSGGNPMIQEGYHFWLSGASDPDVMRLTCLGMLDDLSKSVPPTIAEIRSALGRIATLEIAETDGS